jgi:transposase-like protein
MPIATSFAKVCPKCRSEKTERVSSIWQRLLTMATGFHKYRCLSCGHTFRAGDRRRFPRSGTGAGVDYKR